MLTMSVVKAKTWVSYLGTRRLWPILAMRGFVGAASMTLYYEAIDRMPLADAVSFGYFMCELTNDHHKRQGSFNV